MSLMDLPIVGDVRGDGYFYGLELVKDKQTQARFSAAECKHLLRDILSKRLFELGLICRADDRGEPVIQLSPPLVAGPTELRAISDILRQALGEAWGRHLLSRRQGRDVRALPMSHDAACREMPANASTAFSPRPRRGGPDRRRASGRSRDRARG